jgi:hypothetical protein
MKKVYTNNLQNMINNESCDTTLTQDLGEYFTTNTFGENIKIYYDFSKEES